MNNFKRTAALGVLLLSVFAHGTAFGQAQSKPQQKCINAMNKGMAKVGGTQLKAVAKCASDFAKAKNLDAQACYNTSPKVVTAQTKLCDSEPKKCTEMPDFGFSGCGSTGGTAAYFATQYAGEVFGEVDPNAGITLCAGDKDGCKCQGKALKSSNKLYSTRLKTYNKCKKTVLKDKTTPATSAADLAACLQVDPKMKIAKGVTKLGGAITKKCAAVAIPFAAGDCAGLGGDPLRDCLDERTRCGACLTAEAADNLFGEIDCDLYDDGESNGSCFGDF